MFIKRGDVTILNIIEDADELPLEEETQRALKVAKKQVVTKSKKTLVPEQPKHNKKTGN